MKKIQLLILSLFLLTALSAQEVYRCLTDEVLEHKYSELPGYEEAVNSTFQQAKDLMLNKSGNRSAEYDTTFRIPVVVHIVYLAPEQNLADSVIRSQIDRLNEDFNRLNADTVDTRPEFADVAGSLQVEFYLADTDPMGNPTSGITRTLGTPGLGTFSPFSDDMKKAADGGVNPWPTDQYMNIWVCDILFGFGVLGYAYPPAAAPNWPAGSAGDSATAGVVIQYNVFGKDIPDAPAPEVATGRTCVHEVGHFWGLRHIWGDGDCGSDDGIDDTPLMIDNSGQACDHTKNTCVDVGAIDFHDMIENFMDYSDERCMNMFTKQQAGIMKSMMMIGRPGLAEMKIDTIQDNTTATIAVASDGSAYKVYPNPTKDMLCIELMLENSADVQLMLTDLSGRIIAANTYTGISNKTLQLSTAQLSSGTYLLTVHANGESHTQQVNILH